MKKFIIYIAAFAALATVSCTRSEADFKMKDTSLISITLNPDEMATRASAIPDVEGVVSQFDWFFYPDATGTSAPVYHGHVTVNEDGTLTPTGTIPDGYDVDDKGHYYLGFNIKTNYSDLKGTYYVYVLANYDGIDHDATDLKLTTLLAKTMETQWDELNADYEDIADFIMDSYSGDDEADYPQLVPLSAAKAGTHFTENAEDGEGILTVGLRRVAAKMTFTLNISEKLADPSGNGTFWRPLTKSDNFDAYLVNAVSYAEVKGEPQDAEDMAPDFITGNTGITGGHQISYATSHIMTATDAEGKPETYSPLVWKLDPFYTYPVEFETESNNAPYLKIALPWENVDAEGNLVNQGATLFYYKVYLMDPDAETKTPLTSYERNNHYIVTVNVDVLGGSPEDYTTLETFYYVADWQAPAGGTYGGYEAPRYLDVRSEYTIYGDNSITIAVTSSHAISTQIRSVSQKTISGGNKMTTVPSNAKATPDGRVAFTLEYPLTTTMAGGNMDITPITWVVRVSHADDSTIYEDVTIYQYPSIYGEMRRTGYAATATNFSNTTDSYYTFLNGTRYSYSNTGTAVQANNSGVYLGSINGGSPTSRDKLILTVSTLASLQNVTAFTKDGTTIKFSDVPLGDPRVRISTLWDGDALTHQGLTWSRTDLGEATNYIDNYLVASPDRYNYIAPRFMFPAGRLGSNRINSNLEQGGSWRANAERCAAYQEGGYPAGRWRLPTEAEVAFCKQLQDEGYISGMYYDGNRYWTASGTYYLDGVVIDPADEPDRRATSQQANDGSGIYRTASSRCVYDLWYWGEDPYNNDKQHIKLENVEWVNPATANTPANTWLGFMTE